MQQWEVTVQDESGFTVSVYVKAETEKEAITETYRESQFFPSAIVSADPIDEQAE